MEVYTTEEQQLEAIKRWFKKYGNTVLWCVTIILACFAGFNYWRHHQEVVREQVSENYISFITALEQNDKTSAKNMVDKIIQESPKSAYAVLASFAMAKNSIDDNDYTQAEQYLQWVQDRSTQPNFQAIARVRLMRLLMSQNKLNEALNLYEEKNAGEFLTLLAELKGDVLIKQNDKAGAIKAYELALKSAPEEGMYGPLLKMKLQNLGVDLEKLSAKTEVAGKEAKK